MNRSVSMIPSDTSSDTISGTGRQDGPFPSLVIDLRWNRIRIHKQTLHLLGDPEYIQLLLNPVSHTFAIKKSKDGEHQAYKLRTLPAGKSCELHSKILLNTMSDVFLYLDIGQTYRITGTYNRRCNLAHFSLKDAKCISTNDKEHAIYEP